MDLQPVLASDSHQPTLRSAGVRPDVAQTFSAAPAPASNMTSQAVLAAQPKSAPDAMAKIGSAARAAPADVARIDKVVAHNLHCQAAHWFVRFSIKEDSGQTSETSSQVVG